MSDAFMSQTATPMFGMPSWMTAQQAPQQPQEQQEPYPQVDYEAPATPEKGENFETLYQQLEDLKGKVKPGNLLRLYDKSGNDFYYQRDDDYNHGFSWFGKACRCFWRLVGGFTGSARRPIY